MIKKNHTTRPIIKMIKKIKIIAINKLNNLSKNSLKIGVVNPTSNKATKKTAVLNFFSFICYHQYVNLGKVYLYFSLKIKRLVGDGLTCI